MLILILGLYKNLTIKCVYTYECIYSYFGRNLEFYDRITTINHIYIYILMEKVINPVTMLTLVSHKYTYLSILC